MVQGLALRWPAQRCAHLLEAPHVPLPRLTAVLGMRAPGRDARCCVLTWHVRTVLPCSVFRRVTWRTSCCPCWPSTPVSVQQQHRRSSTRGSTAPARAAAAGTSAQQQLRRGAAAGTAADMALTTAAGTIRSMTAGATAVLTLTRAASHPAANAAAGHQPTRAAAAGHAAAAEAMRSGPGRTEGVGGCALRS